MSGRSSEEMGNITLLTIRKQFTNLIMRRKYWKLSRINTLKMIILSNLTVLNLQVFVR